MIGSGFQPFLYSIRSRSTVRWRRRSSRLMASRLLIECLHLVLMRSSVACDRSLGSLPVLSFASRSRLDKRRSIHRMPSVRVLASSLRICSRRSSHASEITLRKISPRQHACTPTDPYVRASCPLPEQFPPRPSATSLDYVENIVFHHTRLPGSNVPIRFADAFD